jgi:hypothetical protein
MYYTVTKCHMDIYYAPNFKSYSVTWKLYTFPPPVGTSVHHGDCKVKVKFTLEQATKAQRGEYRYSTTLSLTSALDGGVWSTPRPGRFTPGNDPVPIVQEAAWRLCSNKFLLVFIFEPFFILPWNCVFMLLTHAHAPGGGGLTFNYAIFI